MPLVENWQRSRFQKEGFGGRSPAPFRSDHSVKILQCPANSINAMTKLQPIILEHIGYIFPLILILNHFASGIVWGRDIAHGDFTTKAPTIDKKRLQEFFKGKLIAGNAGDYYLNLDNGHSTINIKKFPQLGSALAEGRLASGEEYSQYQHVIVGNASLGTLTDSRGRNIRGSLINNYYTSPNKSPNNNAERLYSHYRNNVMLVFPAVACYGPGVNGFPGYGDYFPANTAYTLGSVGISGSDKAFVKAWIHTLASFQPLVKKKLKEEGLLMPTIQMIFRMSNSNIASPGEYLTGKAHPPAFYGGHIDVLKMCGSAATMTADVLPPMVQLNIVEESLPILGVDFFDPRFAGDKIFDTPAAFARAFRGNDQVKTLTVSADYSYDVNNLPITFHWTVLRGDPDKIKIIPQNHKNSVVSIHVPYFEKYKDPYYGLYTNRVEIGVFVNNGVYFSAPGFITVLTFADEMRTYDDHGRIIEIGYNVGDSKIGYDTGDEGIPFNVFGSKYDIKDWKALFETMSTSDTNTLASELFWTRLGEKHRPTFDHCREQLETIHERMKKAEEDPAVAKDTIKAAKQEAYTLLVTTGLHDGHSIKQLIENVLNTIKNDHKLYENHQVEIHRLVDKLTKSKPKNTFLKSRQRLIKLGILVDRGDGSFGLHSIVDGPSTVESRLTKYERNQLEWFNITLMSQILYPQFMDKRFRVNSADVRLSTPKSWFRDTYDYNKNGELAGWTRYATDGISKYDHQGNLVDNGKVAYKFERTQPFKKGNWYDIHIIPTTH